MVQYCTGVAQRELKSTLKSGPIVKKKEKRCPRDSRRRKEHKSAPYGPVAYISYPVNACPPLSTLGRFIMVTLTPHREHHEGVDPVLVSAAYTPDTDTDTDTRLSALPSRMFSCGVEPVASPRRETTPRAVRATRG